MADRHDGHVPSHWNCYRPNDSHSDRSLSDNRTSGRRPSWTYANRMSNRETPSTYGNPNNISVAARPAQFPEREHGRPRLGPIPIQQSDYDDLPKLWSAELHSLFGRTSRAYDVVVHYLDRSGGGKRWTDESIELIREAGKDIDYDFDALQKWQHTVERVEKEDKNMVQTIENDVERLRALCETVQKLICEHEYWPSYYGERVRSNYDGWSSSVRDGGVA